MYRSLAEKSSHKPQSWNYSNSGPPASYRKGHSPRNTPYTIHHGELNMLFFSRSSVDEISDRYWSSILLAIFVRFHRQQLGMSVSYAADLAGLQFEQWAALEAGWVPTRGSGQLYSVAGTLKVNTDSLLRLAGMSRTEAPSNLQFRTIGKNASPRPQSRRREPCAMRRNIE